MNIYLKLVYIWIKKDLSKALRFYDSIKEVLTFIEDKAKIIKFIKKINIQNK